MNIPQAKNTNNKHRYGRLLLVVVFADGENVKTIKLHSQQIYFIAPNSQLLLATKNDYI